MLNENTNDLQLRFAKSEEIKRDHHLFDERQYEKEYAWLYYNFSKNGYLCNVREVFYRSSSEKPGGSRGAWLQRAVHSKDNPGKKLTLHDESDSHGFALKSLTNLKIKEALEKLDESNKEKSKANELYIEKLIKIVHFLARNNLPVEELYPKMIKFLSDEINEPIVKQYLETCPKNAAYDSSDSCDSILVALNSHLKEKSIKTLINAVDLAIFADEAASAARKEMMGLFLSAYDEEKKEVVIEFVSIASVSSTKSRF